MEKIALIGGLARNGCGLWRRGFFPAAMREADAAKGKFPTPPTGIESFIHGTLKKTRQ